MSMNLMETPRAPYIPTTEEVIVFSHPRTELNSRQKDWLRERDRGACQFPFAHECVGRPQLHHIDPMHWGLNREGKTPQEINDAANILSLCEAIHVGNLSITPDPEMFHPDSRQAKLDYQVDRHAFADVAKKHKSLTLLGIQYWFSHNDGYLKSIADFRTRMKQKKAQHPYPGSFKGGEHR